MSDLLVTFDKPYTFEGHTYTEIDLSGIADLTTKQLCDIQRRYVNGGNVAPSPELDINYAVIVCAEATPQPIEFFSGLPGREGVKVRNAVTRAFFGTSAE